MANPGEMLRVPQYTYAPATTELHEATYAAISFTLDNLTYRGLEIYSDRAFQPEGQPEGSYSATHTHEAQVGALLLATTNSEIALAGSLHDTGKGRPAVRETILQPRVFSPDERRRLVRDHSRFGARDLKGAVQNPELNETAQFVAAKHHAQRPDSFKNSREKYLWDVNSLVAVADQTQAMLLDWKRVYKAQRMSQEGLMDPQYHLNMDGILKVILGDEGEQSYLGYKASDIIDFAAHHMPEPEWIESEIAAQQRSAAKLN